MMVFNGTTVSAVAGEMTAFTPQMLVACVYATPLCTSNTINKKARKRKKNTLKGTSRLVQVHNDTKRDDIFKKLNGNNAFLFSPVVQCRLRIEVRA